MEASTNRDLYIGKVDFLPHRELPGQSFGEVGGAAWISSSSKFPE